MFAFFSPFADGAAPTCAAQPGRSSARRLHPWRTGFTLALALTLVLLLLPAPAVLALKIWIVSWWPSAQTLTHMDASAHADKWLHGSLFALLGALGMAAWRRPGQRRWLWLGLLLLAPTTELLQQWSPGRSASWGDALADWLGLYVGGSLLWQGLRRWAGAGEVTAKGKT